MIITRDETEEAPNPVDSDRNDEELIQCQNTVDHCERNEDRLQRELDDCLASQGTPGDDTLLQEELQTCQDLQETLHQQLDACQNSRNTLQGQLSAVQQLLRACEASNTDLLSSESVCPPGYKGKDGQTLRQGRGTFKFNCKAKRTGEILRTTGRGFEMCLQTCAKEPQCGGINYWTHKPVVKQRCEMFRGRPGWTTTNEKVIGALVQGRH